MAWYPTAQRLPGPGAKSGYSDHTTSIKEGAVLHSAEGTWEGLLAVLHDYSRPASWHFSIRQDGHVAQHYDTDAITWHAGGPEPNRRFVGIELEGTAPAPITDEQVAAVARLLRWLQHVYRWPALIRRQQLWEHREMTQFGSPPTACPSGRIRWQDILERAADPLDPPDPLHRPIVGLGGPLTAMLLREWRWQRATVADYHQAVVGFWEGWLIPPWLHAILFKEETS